MAHKSEGTLKGRGINPLILNLGAGWSCVINLATKPHYPRAANSVRYSLKRKRCGPQKYLALRLLAIQTNHIDFLQSHNQCCCQH